MNYKRIGDYIELVDERNKELKVTTLLGLSISKQFIPSVANTIGTNMKNYKIIRKNQFACSVMQVRRDGKMPVALLKDFDEAIISQAYPVFQVIDEEELLPDYLMMWFTRSEFDREATFHAVGGVRGSLEWEDFLDFELPIPSIEKQQQIVAEYNTVTNRIQLNEKINTNLEATAQALYKHWFVDFEFPYVTSSGVEMPYKSSGGKMVYNEELDTDIPVGWSVERLGDISNLKYGKMLNSDLFLPEGYPVFSGYGIRGYYSEYMYKERQILVLCRGVSGTGRVELSPPKSYITNLSIIVQPDKSILKKLFLYFYLKNDNLRELDSGSAQSQITTGDLGFRNILTPSIVLQEHFDIKVNTILNNISSAISQTKTLKELQSLLLAKMTQSHIKTELA
ncbi:restriction endonuclease subunit S [uncultured Dokdonia sp.]|uniref:restriction endonuclease subunit S n=1 Tax=uncultured Dokdonia sp. TaxID=575653 RepID=UPI00261B29AB|nr:restriction endonuclease subunit S [uncultured Dokdonia sp.]